MVEIRLYDDDGNVVDGHRSGGDRRAVRAQPVGVRRLLQAARQVRGGPPRRLPDRRRHRLPRRRGLPLHLRPQEGHDHLRRDEHLSGRDRGRARAASRHLRGGRVRHPERGVGRDACTPSSSSGRAPTSTRRRVTAHAREHLAGYKVPRSISWIDELPKTGSGKILKRELRPPFWADRTSQGLMSTRMLTFRRAPLGVRHVGRAAERRQVVAVNAICGRQGEHRLRQAADDPAPGAWACSPDPTPSSCSSTRRGCTSR